MLSDVYRTKWAYVDFQNIELLEKKTNFVAMYIAQLRITHRI